MGKSGAPPHQDETSTLQGEKLVVPSGCSHPGGLNIDGTITGFLGLNVPVYIVLTQV